jgi:signal transduction histidine kinase
MARKLGGALVNSGRICSRWRLLARLALFAALCFASVQLGQALSFQPERISALWPPSGVLLAGLLLSRRRHWPAVVLTAFLIEALSSLRPFPELMGLLMAGANVLEALIGASLLRRLVGPLPDLRRVRDVLGLLLLSATLATLLTATFTVSALFLGGLSGWEEYWRVWRVFWIGNAMGVLVLTPLIFSWAQGLKGWSTRQRLELGALLTVLGVAAHVVFRDAPSGAFAFQPLVYLAFPFVFWAAVRFEARGATAVLALLSTITIWHTIEGRGPFITDHPSVNQRLFHLQAFLGAAGISGLLLAAALGERRRAQAEVSALNQELRQSLEMLAQAQSELVFRERMAALGELSATVAHEVRNPLGAIANCVSALRHLPGRRADPQEEPLLDIITEEVQRLDQLVHGLLDFTRPVQPLPRPQPIERVVEGALSAVLRAQEQAPAVEVRREVAPGLPPALVDARLLHMALSNLFTNALQAMPAGGTLTVKVEPEQDAKARALRLSVSDTGIGMSPEVQARIFKPFFTTRARGTGLGLPIVRRIIDAHSGQVAVHSAEGLGTTFTLRLPCVSPAGEQLAARP